MARELHASDSAGERPYPIGHELELIAFRNMLHDATEAIYFKDLESRFVAVSRALAVLHGREPDALLGLTDFDVFTPEHASEAYADEQQIIATGIPMLNKEEKETWPNRGDTWVTSNKRPLRDHDGTIIGTFGLSRDITRRVNAEVDAASIADALFLAHAELGPVEAQLRTVLDTSSDGIARYDTQLCYQNLNAAARRAAEDPYWDFLGRTDRELGRDEAFLAVWEAGLKSVLSTGEGCAVDFSPGAGRDLRRFASQLTPQRDTEHG